MTVLYLLLLPWHRLMFYVVITITIRIVFHDDFYFSRLCAHEQ